MSISQQLWLGTARPLHIILLVIVIVASWLGYLWIVLRGRYRSGSRNRRISVVPARHYPLWWSRLILIVLLLNSCISIFSASVFYWPPSKIIILVADFDGPDPQKYRVSETMLDRLQRALQPYEDVEVRHLGHTILEAEGGSAARTAGEQQKATIVIWGWYGTTTPPLISVHFELLRQPEGFPELGPAVQGAVQVVDSKELDSPSLQVQLSSEMAYLSLFTVGMTRYAAEDWDEAIRRFTDALGQIESETIVTDKNLALLYRANSYLFKGDHDQSITEYNQIMLASPDNMDAYLWRGLAFARKDEYQKAIADYNQVLARRSNDVDAYNRRGNAYFYAEKYDDAILDYSKVIALNPEYTTAYYNRANVYAEQREYDKALADYDYALSVHPDFVMYYWRRGALFSNIANYRRAISDFNQAIYYQSSGGFSESSSLYTSRGDAYYYNKEYTNAISDYNKAIDIRADATLYFNRGNAYFAQGRVDQAISDYNEAIRQTLPLEMVVSVGGQESPGGTEEVVRMPLNEDKLARFYYGRGLAYVHKGERVKAIEDFRTVLKQDIPDFQAKAREQLKLLGTQ